jgi:ribosomal protein S18 acetylase RimI-like enzyme
MLVYVPRELYDGPPPDGLFESAERYFNARLGGKVEGLCRKLTEGWRTPDGRRWSLALDDSGVVGFACGAREGEGFRVTLLFLSGRNNSAENGLKLIDRLVRGEGFALASGVTLSPPPGELGVAMQRAGWTLLPRERRVLLFKEAGLSKPPVIEGYHLRRLRREDVRVLALIQAAAFHGTPDAQIYPALADPADSERMLTDCLEGAFGRPIPRGCLVVQRRDRLMGGFILSAVEERPENGRLGFVVTFAVSPPQRGRGLGRLLLSHALASYAAAGLAGSSLQVSSSNLAATALYDSLGYGVTGAETAYRLDAKGI